MVASNKTSLSKLAFIILLAFQMGIQFNLLGFLFRPHSALDNDHDDVKRSDDCVDCPELTQEVPPSSSSRHANDTSLAPSYLQWSTKRPEIPQNWSYNTPKYYREPENFSPDSNQKIIVHYHLQHNAGTSFYQLAHNFTAATRACWQSAKHCLVSYNQDVEAENIRNNYFQYGIQYVSYEVMLPPRFPLPFVSESAREGLFFTTIMRNPMSRLITWSRSDRHKPKVVGGPTENFWNEVSGKSGIYMRENLNVRWLSGSLDAITEDHLNIAKCRLQLFDLVIADTLYDTAVNEVVCPLNNWQGRRFCNPNQSNEPKDKKQDPLNATDSHFIGAWIERLRPSFELYDYARILSYAQLKAHGVKDVPPVSEVPSYIATLSKYTNITLEVPEESRVSLTNIYKLHPPREFCEKMKTVWESNADEVPYIDGIGGLAGTS